MRSCSSSTSIMALPWLKKQGTYYADTLSRFSNSIFRQDSFMPVLNNDLRVTLSCCRKDFEFCEISEVPRIESVINSGIVCCLASTIGTILLSICWWILDIESELM